MVLIMSDNLPPGVSSDMIPGNSTEDHHFELVIDWLYLTGLSAGEIKTAVVEYGQNHNVPISTEPPI